MSLIALLLSFVSLIVLLPLSLIVLPLSYLARLSNPFLTLTIEYVYMQYYTKDYDTDYVDITLF